MRLPENIDVETPARSNTQSLRRTAELVTASLVNFRGVLGMPRHVVSKREGLHIAIVTPEKTILAPIGDLEEHNSGLMDYQKPRKKPKLQK